MNGIDKIKQRITQEVQGEIAALEAQAKAQASGITDRYAAQAKALADEITTRGAAAAREREERLVSMAHMEAKKAQLAVKQELLEEAFRLALDTLCTLPEKEYTALLTALTVQAARSGREAVLLSPKDRETVGEAVVRQANARLKNGQLTLAQETRPIRGGVILSDGAVEVNGSFETILRLERPRMAKDIAGILFPQEG